MKLQTLFLLAGGFSLAGLSACGGGGGDSGDCSGSQQVCAGAASAPPPAPAPADPGGITCAAFTTQAAAQAAFAAGAFQLDSNGDGIACNET